MSENGNYAAGQIPVPTHEPLAYQLVSRILLWSYPNIYNVHLTSLANVGNLPRLQLLQFRTWKETYHYDVLKHLLLSTFVIFAGMDVQYTLVEGITTRSASPVAAHPVPAVLGIMSIACAVMGVFCGETLKHTLFHLSLSPQRRAGWIHAARDARASLFDPSLILALPAAWSVWGLVLLIMQRVASAFYAPLEFNRELPLSLRVTLTVLLVGGALYSALAVTVFQKMGVRRAQRLWRV